MKILNLTLLSAAMLFVVACGSAQVQTLDDIPESYIVGTQDLGIKKINSSISIYDENGTFIRDEEYPYAALHVINDTEELEDVKRFFVGDTKLDEIDLSEKTILILYRLDYPNKISDITIKETQYDAKNHVHCKVYKYTKQMPGQLANATFLAMSRVFVIPKTPTDDITYEVIELNQ